MDKIHSDYSNLGKNNSQFELINKIFYKSI